MSEFTFAIPIEPGKSYLLGLPPGTRLNTIEDLKARLTERYPDSTFTFASGVQSVQEDLLPHLLPRVALQAALRSAQMDLRRNGYPTDPAVIGTLDDFAYALIKALDVAK